ncbi:hypothetical protein [Amycolatopsis sp. lyj-112]|uniref:hypothetical protein n=1 Tax=Amycolatopsis sp. lyj-112 TaxID=2789288 RepID=UPI003979805C
MGGEQAHGAKQSPSRPLNHLKPEMSGPDLLGSVATLLTEFESGIGLLPAESREAVTAATAMARREADRALYRRLVRQGFAGTEYEIFRGELAAYGFPVLKSWIRTGRVFSCCAQRGRPLKCSDAERRHLSVDEGDRVDLASETAAIALNIFHDHVLVPGVWNDEAGASLKTYFVGGCINAFPNVFRRWLREHRRWAGTDTYGFTSELDTVTNAALSTTTDPAEIVASEHVVYDALAAAKPTGREAAARRVFLDERFAEIADHLNTTERAVEGLLYRVRSAASKRKQEPGQR